jgi:ATP-dependent Clp protease ATP-binding subunit ClpA
MTKKQNWQMLDADAPSGIGQKTLRFLKYNIKGQDDALKDIVDAIEIREASFQEGDKPIYCGIALGPSGVGKTLTTEVLAELWFGSRRGFTRIACEAYSEPHSISKLIGSPPGYVGFWDSDKGGGSAPILAQESIDKYALQASASNKRIEENIKKLQEA